MAVTPLAVAQVRCKADRISDLSGDRGEIDEPGRDRDVGDVGDLELVQACRYNVPGEVREDRPIVIAVSRCPSPAS